ncbi:DUF982 domain-containing protein [Rhizobium sp. WSM1274]|uniref:DUF982 domain-containing protein n=1 Tax=Rhizobium sp. WSM1274 TaxID=3138254 RepID=UPI0021A958CE|nr:DUF982 domain-containing protein [Rhizobium leguminosarum]UWU29195.1 DUF982 domain-containing protein [Rhizobium leguminosarum bv. viciae]
MERVGIVAWPRSEDFAPLMLVINAKEKHRVVRSLGDVAEALVAAWPTGDGKEYIAAIRTCLDAIQGNVPAKLARAAFIRAAEEAGIPVIAVIN